MGHLAQTEGVQMGKRNLPEKVPDVGVEEKLALLQLRNKES